MKNLLLSILLLSSLSFSKEYNFDNLLELNGLWTKKFSTEIANGKVYKMYGVNKVYIGQIRNGKMNGEWTDWYENGKKQLEAIFKDGKEEGLSTIWYENGQKKVEVTLKDGEFISSKCWDEDGNECECGEPSWEGCK